jgi:cytochrome c biogenesis protein CcmG, thiol:disulfide interchange protein DsbE
MKKYLFKFPIIFFLFILTIFFYLLIIDRNPSTIPSNLIDKYVPEFEAKSLLNNEKFSSIDEFKNEITLVNFFASWCKPCRDEHIYIKKLANKNKIKIIGINFKDDEKKSISWLKDLGNPYSNIAVDKNGKIAIDWGVYGIPETFLVNSKGIIKYKHVGAITEQVYKKINSIIKKLNDID